MRRGRWLCLVLVSCLALAWLSANAAEPSTQNPPQALILYDSAPPYAWLGELHALQIANLLGHFPVEWTIEPVDGYLAGEVEDYSVTFYIGDIFDNPLPGAFLSDVMTTEKTICWFKYNLWQIAWDEDGYWDPAFTSRYGFQFAWVDASGFPEVLYKDQSLVKDLSDPDLGATVIVDPDQAEVRAVAYRPGPSIDASASWPYVVHSRNLWYFADTPLTYISEEDRYLVFCDLLHDIVGIDHAPSRRALIRIEDVDPTCDPADLVAVADYLYSQGVPFQVAVIPVFRDPLGVLGGEYPEELRLSESPAVVAALHYMIARGGQIILHGYTHQYDAVPNPYNGLTADDCEFFRTVWNDEGKYTEFIGPVEEDSVAWVNGRIDAGLAEMALCDLPVAAWETPHYVASALDSVEFGNRFSLTTGRVLYFSESSPYFAGQFYPCIIESDIYGQRILPENLGNVEPEAFYDYPPRLPADIVNAAEKNLVVRDAWASSYFHPYFHIKYLKQVVNGVKGLGYTYSTIPPLLAEAGPGKAIAAGGWETLEGSASGGEPPYSYSWTPTIGLDDPNAAQPAASPETTTTYTLTVTDDLGQTASDPVTVIVVPPVVAEAGPDKIIAAGGSTALEGSGSGGEAPYSYSWTPTAGLDDPSAAQPAASPESTTTYTLTVTDDLGQTDTDTVTVTVASGV
ncbi:MAG: polysaccharide deacetylase family protein, partial [Armatimonadota bacterium]